jgi:hypothetical protein
MPTAGWDAIAPQAKAAPTREAVAGCASMPDADSVAIRGDEHRGTYRACRLLHRAHGRAAVAVRP